MRGRIEIKGKDSMITYFVADTPKNLALTALVDKDTGEPSEGSNKTHGTQTTQGTNATHTLTDGRSSHSHSRSTHGDFLNFLRDSINEDDSDSEVLQNSFDCDINEVYVSEEILAEMDDSPV